jgi:ribosomal protein S18 acetylase RimI-like enzyme
MTPVLVRSAEPADRDALYEVCLLTGDGGRDATPLYPDRTLLGDVFVGPYLALYPDLALVADDGTGAAGYALGALETDQFERACELSWWPGARARHPVDPAATGDHAALVELLHRPGALRHPSFPEYPSHLHIDLREHIRGGGVGRQMLGRLFELLTDAGSSGVHLGVDLGNTGAQRFYRRLGFVDLQTTDDGVLYQGMLLR